MRGFFVAAIVLSIALPWQGADASMVAARYQAYWAGLPAGEFRLTLRDDASEYHDRIDIRTEGLPHLATRFGGVAISDGRIAADRPSPLSYSAAYALRKEKHKRLSLHFDVLGGVIIADRGADDTSKKPPLAERFRTNVFDPLSALTMIRDELRRGNRRAFSVPVYDGARRFDVIAKVMPKRSDDRLLHLELTLAPIAGFKGESSDDGDPDNAPRPVSLTISDDQRLLPVSMSVSLYYMPLVVQLVDACDKAAPCSK